jgi:hypothetical protein
MAAKILPNASYHTTIALYKEAKKAFLQERSYYMLETDPEIKTWTLSVVEQAYDKCMKYLRTIQDESMQPDNDPFISYELSFLEKNSLKKAAEIFTRL